MKGTPIQEVARRSAAWVRPGNFGWFVLILARTRINDNTSLRSRESVAIRHAVIGVHLPSYPKTYTSRRRWSGKSIFLETPMEMLLNELLSNNILHAYDRADQDLITKLFFAPIFCVQLAIEVLHVMIMDCTYKVIK